MTTPNDDRRLRDAFAELREVERYELPALASVLTRGPRRPRSSIGSAVGLIAIAAAFLAVAAVALRYRSSRNPQPQSISEWRAPTDGLLQTPGRELIQAVPSLRSNVLGSF